MNKCPICSVIFAPSQNTICKLCNSKLCSIKCLLKHSSSHSASEQAPKNQPQIIQSLRAKQTEHLTEIYPYVPKGKFLTTAEYSSEYTFGNFAPVTLNGFPYELGSGSFGRVILSKCVRSNKYCAIKTMNKARIRQGCGSLSVIYNEIRIHSKLVHKNIIRLYNVYENDAEIKMMMEYANKGTLYETIKKTRNGFSEGEAFTYFIQVVFAIIFLHENNVIHRDLKPENLLLTENDVVKLCDFGWSKEIDLSKRSTFCGTVEYMAPEIVDNKCYDMGIDIWSLGILLYELCHGFSPFVAKTSHEIMIKIKEHNVKFFKNLSKDCKDLILSLLEPNADIRMKSKDILNSPFVVNNISKLPSTMITAKSQRASLDDYKPKKNMWKSNSFNKLTSFNKSYSSAIDEVKGNLFREKSKAKDKIGSMKDFNNRGIESFEEMRDNVVKEKKSGSIKSTNRNIKPNQSEYMETVQDANDDRKKNSLIKTYNLIPHAKKKIVLNKKSNKENISNNIVITKTKKEEKNIKKEEEEDSSMFSKIIKTILNI